MRGAEPGGRPGGVAGLLANLTRLGDAAHIATAVAEVCAKGRYDEGDNEVLAGAIALLPPGQASDLLDRTIARNAPWRAAACLEHLERRIAEELSLPADFARPSALPCTCRDCAELSAFLADPVRKTWVFRATEARRRHVEDSIRRADCDVDTETDRSGRPYALVCAKNAKSCQRRVAQRKKDLTDRARLMQA